MNKPPELAMLESKTLRTNLLRLMSALPASGILVTEETLPVLAAGMQLGVAMAELAPAAAKHEGWQVPQNLPMSAMPVAVMLAAMQLELQELPASRRTPRDLRPGERNEQFGRQWQHLLDATRKIFVGRPPSRPILDVTLESLEYHGNVPLRSYSLDQLIEEGAGALDRPESAPVRPAGGSLWA